MVIVIRRRARKTRGGRGRRRAGWARRGGGAPMATPHAEKGIPHSKPAAQRARARAPGGRDVEDREFTKVFVVKGGSGIII